MSVILIVEDEIFIHEIARLIVEEMGHSTLSAYDINQAQILLHSTQRIDALFTDVRLKTAAQGGFELSHQAVRLRPKLRVLYATGNSITDEMTTLFVEGARVLSKPYSECQLQNSIEELLAAPF